MGPKSSDKYTSGSEGHSTDTHAGGGNGTRKSRIGVMQPHTKEYKQPPEAGRAKEQILPYRFHRKAGSADTLILDL